MRLESPPPFPRGRFRFFALDVETAGREAGSICQIGVACVGRDGRITPWVTDIDPQTGDWSCTRIHGITAARVAGAPLFQQAMAVLAAGLRGQVVYQHSRFDERAMAAACARAGLEAPGWHWRDSVTVARRAWPALRGNGGHGLASLKAHLGLSFTHHDAGEDARAAAEVVLRAEAEALPALPLFAAAG